MIRAAAFLVGALTLVGCTATVPGHATSVRPIFLDTLNLSRFDYHRMYGTPVSDDQLRGMAHDVCQGVTQGRLSGTQVAHIQVVAFGYSVEQADTFVNAAIDSYCPEES